MENTIHTKINYRANLSNKEKAFGLNNTPKFLISLGNFSSLKRYERLSNYNNHKGYYNRYVFQFFSIY